MFTIDTLDAESLQASLPMLERMPLPALWIHPDHEVAWTNSLARETYGVGTGPCYAVTHGYDVPCPQRGEICPMVRAESSGEPAVVGHAHVTSAGADLFMVVAIPIEGGGGLELHVDIGSELVRDATTGLHTRPFFSQLVRRELALLRRMELPYALLFADLDLLKELNDSHGHAVGDAARRMVGATISGCTRSMDCTGRWGGDEFLAFLPGTDREGAEAVARRIRRGLDASERAVAGLDRPVTVSIGIVAVSSDCPFDDALERADQALYAAKSGGRDRTVVAGDR